MFEIRVESDGVVHLSGRLDAAEADRATDELKRLDGPVILDCSALEYISSAGLSVLMLTYKRLTTAGKALRLVHLQPKVRNVITYAGLHRVLDIG